MTNTLGANTDAWIETMKRDHRQAELSAADRAMLDYVAVLTATPAQTQRAHLERMRGAGMSDRAILEANLIAGYFAWCNRLVDGLGVELEGFWETPGITNL